MFQARNNVFAFSCTDTIDVIQAINSIPDSEVSRHIKIGKTLRLAFYILYAQEMHFAVPPVRV